MELVIYNVELDVMRIFPTTLDIYEWEEHTKLWSENLRSTDHAKYVGVDWRIILKWNVRVIGLEAIDWRHLTQKRNKWRALVNTLMNHKKQGISWLADWLLASQELCSMELVG
jgi:hypothetical protein